MLFNPNSPVKFSRREPFMVSPAIQEIATQAGWDEAYFFALADRILHRIRERLVLGHLNDYVLYNFGDYTAMLEWRDEGVIEQSHYFSYVLHLLDAKSAEEMCRRLGDTTGREIYQK